MRADRLLSLVLLLQAHGRMTGRELARRLEVSQRTVHRDMDALSAAGVPVYALRGARGGWQLDEDWRTRVPGLDEVELRALLMAQPRVLGDARLVAAAERALAKLLAALPQSLRGPAAAMRQRLHVDTSAWHGAPEDLGRLPLVQDAVARDRRLSIRYRSSAREVTTRSVDPLGLVAKGGTWYLVAGTGEGLRTFRVSRIEHAVVLEQPVRRPADFDLAAHWKAATEELRRGWTRYETTLRLEPQAAAAVRCWRPMSPLPERRRDREGWGRYRVRFEHEDQACSAVLSLGSRAEVIAPDALRERVAAEVAAMMERARGGRRRARDASLEPGARAGRGRERRA